MWLVLPAASVIGGLALWDLGTWSQAVMCAPLPLVGALGLLYRKAWGWWLLLAMMMVSCTLYGLAVATGLAFDQNAQEQSRRFLLVAVMAAATVVVLLSDPPRKWAE